MLSIHKFKFNKILNYTRVVREHPKPIRFLVGYFLVLTGLSRLFVIKTNGYKLRFFPTALSLSIFSNPEERFMDEFYLSKILKSGDKYIDIGANIGTLVLRSSELIGETGHAYAVEAHPVTARYLMENIALNKCKNVTAYNKAAGEEMGLLFFSDKGADDQNHVVLDKNGIEVEVVRIDELVSKHENYRLLKIDAEGYELNILKGSTELFPNIDVIYYESDEKHCSRFGYSTSDIIEFLMLHKWKVLKVKSEKISVLDSGYISLKREYLFAVKNESVFAQQTGFDLTTKGK